MNKRTNATTLLRSAPPPAGEPAASFFARLRAAVAGLRDFFTQSGEGQAAKDAEPPDPPGRAPRGDGGEGPAQRKRLRVVHTGTRI